MVSSSPLGLRQGTCSAGGNQSILYLYILVDTHNFYSLIKWYELYWTVICMYIYAWKCRGQWGVMVGFAKTSFGLVEQRSDPLWALMRCWLGTSKQTNSHSKPFRTEFLNSLRRTGLLGWCMSCVWIYSIHGDLLWKALESLRLPRLVLNPRLQSLAKEEKRKRRKRRKRPTSPRLGFFMLSWSHGGCCKLEKVWLVIQVFHMHFLKWSSRIGANWPVKHQSMSSLSKPLSISSAHTILLLHMTFLTFVHILYIHLLQEQIKHPHLHPTKYSLKACVFPNLFWTCSLPGPSKYLRHQRCLCPVPQLPGSGAQLCHGFVAFRLLGSGVTFGTEN